MCLWRLTEYVGRSACCVVTVVCPVVTLNTSPRSMQGGYPRKTWKVGEFHIGQGKVREIRKSQGSCSLLVLCFCRCDKSQNKHNLNRLLLSKVDMHKMECQ